MLMGTSWTLSSRFCALTMTSSMTSPPSCAMLGAAPPKASAAAPADAKEAWRTARATGFNANRRGELELELLCMTKPLLQ